MSRRGTHLVKDSIWVFEESIHGFVSIVVVRLAWSVNLGEF